ncbi:hypothetical protein BDW62DRAFT_199719 [Aspergillus aurantiobrunneus]
MECTQGNSPGFLIPPAFLHSPLPLVGQTGRTPTALADITSKTPNTHLRTNRVKRPHTKSRRGCYNCKNRRVKCQETKPACANCIHKDLDCLYPTEVRERGQVVADRTNGETQEQLTSTPLKDGGSSPAISPSSQISTTPFTGDDLRFWHHFLVDARPYLPFGNEATWLSTIPALAHDCPHLLYAILSLGASHCALITPQGHQYSPVSIAYRGKALKSLSTVLAKGDNCSVLEMDSALATCYTLIFQAHHMSDGVVDFAVMVRGCGLVTNWYFQKRRESEIFNIQSHEQMLQMIASWLSPELQPVHDRETINRCIASLDRLQPLLQTPAHLASYNALRLTYGSLLVSYRHSFCQLVSIYAQWATMDNVEFLIFTAPGNHVSRVLFMHYVTIDCFMIPVYAELMRERSLYTAGGHFLIYRWAEAIYSGLPVSMSDLVRDPLLYLALYLLPGVESHRLKFPQWRHELVGFVEWLRRRVPGDILETYNI